MADYHFHPTLVLRTPVYSYSFYSLQNLREIIKQPFFQRAIYFSSEVFYDELKKADFDVDKLEKKAIDTLKKYFNRMCFRPTPFGICSAFGSLSWGNNASTINFAQNKLRPYIWFSYAKNVEYANELLSAYKPDLIYHINSTFYKTGNEYRFLKQNRGNAQIDFVLDSLKSDRFFEKMLKYLAAGHSLKEIAGYACQQAGCSADEAETYITWLIDNQAITHTLEPNISGTDYLQRLLDQQNYVHNEAYNKVEIDLSAINAIQSVQNLDDIPKGDLKSDDLYVNLAANFADGQLNTAYQQQIINGLYCLDHLSQYQTAPGLSDFIKNFSQKFDGQTIPLLTAIDPEVGVGYGNLAVEDDDVNIVKNLFASELEKNNVVIWTKAHAMLFKKWKTGVAQNQTITLTEADLIGLDVDNTPHSPTTSVMFRVIDDQIFIETAGGVSAISLIGRFTPFDENIKQLACDAAAIEVQHNPGVIFAEIAHICHERTANIDRREHIYTYEIPVLVQSALPPKQQILLNDLWVSVISGQIIIQSKRLGKRVIPRLSSAFNYTRNDLAVFRFLCDLQRAYIKTNYTLNLSQFFPGLDFYPRVQYKNTILHLAYWNLKNEAFADVIKADNTNQHILFKTIRKELSLPQYIALTQHDHQLVFDLEKEDDVLFFLDTIKAQIQFTVKEYLLPSGENPIVNGAGNSPHVNQFIASIYQQQPAYKPVVSPIRGTKNIRTFIPGSQWLYLKLYCHSIRSNELLNDCVGTIIKKLSNDDLLKQWFFIRYSDPGYHIRLRLNINPKDQQQALSTLYQTLNSHVTNSLISNYTIATYEREMERYSPDFMDQFEHTFYTSSNFVRAFLKQHKTTVSAKDILQFAMATTSDMVKALGLEGKSLITFLDQVYTSFSNEFNAINDLKYQLDIAYRSQKPVIEISLQKVDDYYDGQKLQKARMLFIKSLIDLRKDVTDANWQTKWVSDLVHMHLNRLFINDSRKQEMAVYYFLSKYERSAQARKAKNKLIN